MLIGRYFTFFNMQIWYNPGQYRPWRSRWRTRIRWHSVKNGETLQNGRALVREPRCRSNRARSCPCLLRHAPCVGWRAIEAHFNRTLHRSRVKIRLKTHNKRLNEVKSHSPLVNLLQLRIVNLAQFGSKFGKVIFLFVFGKRKSV